MRVAPISPVGSTLCGQTPVFTISSDASAFRRRSFWDARLVAARSTGASRASNWASHYSISA
jgi:hypothetical protein